MRGAANCGAVGMNSNRSIPYHPEKIIAQYRLFPPNQAQIFKSCTVEFRFKQQIEAEFPDALGKLFVKSLLPFTVGPVAALSDHRA